MSGFHLVEAGLEERARFQSTRRLRFEQGRAMLSLRRYQTFLMELSCGLEKQAPCPATHPGSKPHSLGLVTGVVNVVECSNGLAWKLGMAVAEEMYGCQERVDLEMTGRGAKKDQQD